jgi:hypothetical protein
MADGTMVVDLYWEEGDETIASIHVLNGNFACLSGVIDLPEGKATISLRAYNLSYEGWGSYDGAGLQVLRAQAVESRGCSAQDGGCGPT